MNSIWIIGLVSSFNIEDCKTRQHAVHGLLFGFDVCKYSLAARGWECVGLGPNSYKSGSKPFNLLELKLAHLYTNWTRFISPRLSLD